MFDGGKCSGIVYVGQLMFGVDVDFDVVFGWWGVMIKVYGINCYGINFVNSSIGNSILVQEIYGGQGICLVNLIFEQKLFND